MKKMPTRKKKITQKQFDSVRIYPDADTPIGVIIMPIQFKHEEDDFAARMRGSMYKNQIDTLYDVVFRPVIKHGDDAIRQIIYKDVWEKIKEHFDI